MPIEPTKKMDEFDLDVQFHMTTDRTPDFGEIQGSQFSVWASCLTFGCGSDGGGGGGGHSGGSGSHCMCVE